MDSRLSPFHFLRVDTDEGVYGLGESTNMPLVVAGAIHDFCAHEILGKVCNQPLDQFAPGTRSK